MQRMQRTDRTTRIIMFIGIGMAVEVRRPIYSEMAHHDTNICNVAGTHSLRLFRVGDVPSHLRHLQCPGSRHRAARGYVPHRLGMVCSLADISWYETLIRRA